MTIITKDSNYMAECLLSDDTQLEKECFHCYSSYCIVKIQCILLPKRMDKRKKPRTCTQHFALV